MSDMQAEHNDYTARILKRARQLERELAAEKLAHERSNRVQIQLQTDMRVEKQRADEAEQIAEARIDKIAAEETMRSIAAEQRATQQEAEINRLTSVLNDNEEQMEADRTDAARVALEEAAQLCFYERDKANNTEPSTNGSTMNLDHLMGQGWMANLLGKKLQKLASVLRQPEVGPHKDEDGHCAVCGLKWPNERETLEPHECPPGFRAEIARRTPK